MAVIGSRELKTVPRRPNQQIHFGAIREAFSLYRQKFGTWLLAAFITFGMVLTVQVLYYFISRAFGIGVEAVNTSNSPWRVLPALLFYATVLWLIVSLFIGGMYRMAAMQLRGENIRASDMFEVVEVVPALLAVSALIGLAVSLATLFFVLPGFIVAALLMFAPILVVDKGLGPTEAMRQSANWVRHDLLLATLFLVLVALIGWSGSLFYGIGVILTAPVAVLSLAVTYRDTMATVPETESEPVQFRSYA